MWDMEMQQTKGPTCRECDGLWDAVTAADADLIRARWQEHGSRTSKNVMALEAAKGAVAEAERRLEWHKNECEVGR